MTSTSLRRSPPLLTSLVIGLVAGAYFVLTMTPAINPYDEGLIAYGAWRIQAGEMPYLQFWTMYGPGGFYLNAWLFDLFGRSDLTLRVGDVVIRSLTVVTCVMLLVPRGTPARLIPLGVAGLVAIFLGSVASFGFPVFPALLCALLSFLALRRAWEGRSGYYVLAGLLCAGCAAFRHDLGLYCAVASAAATVARIVPLHGKGSFASLRAVLRPALLYAAGLVPPMMALILFLLWRVGSGPLLDNLFWIPATVYPRVRWLPFPARTALREALGGRLKSLSDFAVYVPFMVVMLSVAMAVAYRSRPTRGGNDPHVGLIVLLGCFTALATIKGMVRVSPLHMIQAIVPALTLLGLLAMRAVAAWERMALAAGAAGVMVLAGAALVPAVTFGARALGLQGSTGESLAARCLQPQLPSVRCALLTADLVEVSHYVAAHTTADQTIYVGAGRHDRLFANDVILYFVAERAAPTRWHDLHPGVQTRATTQSEMVDDFERRPPALVVLNTGRDDITEGNDQALSSHVTLLDDAIRARYRPVATFGTFQILEPRT